MKKRRAVCSTRVELARVGSDDRRRVKQLAKAAVIGLMSVGAVVGCSGDKSETATTTTVIGTPSPTLTKGVLVTGQGEEQNFISSVTLFSSYWVMKDANDLVALGRTACVTMATAMSSGLDSGQAQTLAGIKVREALRPNPPSSDDATSFANSALNFLCNDQIDSGR